MFTRNQFLQKRCEKCNEFYSILRVRSGRTQELIIRFATCNICNPNDKQCVTCRVPFHINKHHAKGMCYTCYLYNYRDVTSA